MTMSRADGAAIVATLPDGAAAKASRSPVRSARALWPLALCPPQARLQSARASPLWAASDDQLTAELLPDSKSRLRRRTPI